MYTIEEDILEIKNKKITFEELFNKKIDYTFHKYSYLDNKTLLVTGGAGSIGSSLISQLLKQDIKAIIVLDHSEYGLFKLGLKFKEELKNKKLILFLGDIRNTPTLQNIFSLYPINIIYHTAAYKHIDILENNTNEAVSVNIEGSLNLLEISKQNNVEQFIFISTDKAVNPINKMGISKRITELYLLKQIFSPTSNLKIKIVRFGNVFNSSGSVFNIFKYQIENNLSLTITNKEMKRYFISSFQAIKGLIQMANPKNDSGVYLLNMGQSFKIEELLFNLLKELELKSTPEIIYNSTHKFSTSEKIEEELYFSFEKEIETHIDYKILNLNHYNQEKISSEIKNLNHLLLKNN